MVGNCAKAVPPQKQIIVAASTLLIALLQTLRLTKFQPPNAALERLAHAFTNKGYSAASPLQAPVGRRPEGGLSELELSCREEDYRPNNNSAIECKTE